MTAFLFARDKVKAIYQPPQIPEDENYESLSYKYKGDFRRLFIEQPRVRLDGVYIAVCHYVYVHHRLYVCFPLILVQSKWAKRERMD